MFVCHIHNNSLGRAFEVDTLENGLDFIRGMYEDMFGEMPDEIIDDLHNTWEVSHADGDNINTFSLGKFE